jgi:ubiquinone biosynthesis protein COQ9
VVRRQYHSHDHPPPPGPFTPAESALLGAAYTHVAAQGFSREALALGARDAGLLDISPSLLLGGSDGGVFALIRWHLYTQRNALAGKAAALFASEIDGSPGGSKDATAATPSLGGIGGGIRTVSERVEMLAWARLQGNDEAGVVGRLQEVRSRFIYGRGQSKN